MAQRKRRSTTVEVIHHEEIGREGLQEVWVWPGMVAVIRSDRSDNGVIFERLQGAGFRSDFFTLVLVEAGTMVGRLDKQYMQLNKGDLMMDTPFRMKELVSMSDDSRLLVVSFTVEFLKQMRLGRITDRMALLPGGGVTVSRLIPRERSLIKQRILEVAKRLDGMRAHSFGKELVLNSFTDLLFECGHLGKVRDRGVAVPIGRKEELVARFTLLARDRHLNERNLSFYSERLHVTTKHLSETVKELTGRTAGRLIDEMLLIEAKRLLDESDLGIAEIAYRLKFMDPASFSKFFARLEGISPRQYRKG